ncbi:hypothetical protein [Herbidospora mongoliensis]|uniref:hypothetical protein n=1 Tax=Herbidospora mongoliensis TaxID=688067 RepID=UPI000834E2FC|nr:hypothetical protein [Herbidospora mongoliensis]
MAGIPPILLAGMGQDVTIEPFLGASGRGPTYGPAVVVRGLVERKRKRTRGTDGTDTSIETILRMPLDTVCPVDSRITIAGETATVAAAVPFDGGSLPVPSHLEVVLS